jgi:hypothetical protein
MTVDLADGHRVAELVRRVRADLVVVGNSLIPPPLREVAERSLSNGLARLDELLVRPLRAEGDLFVAGRGLLLGLPWSALPSRRGLRTAVNSHVARGPASRRRAGRTARVLVAAGPGPLHGTAEARAVADVWRAARPDGSPDEAAPVETVSLEGERATGGAVREALPLTDVVHLAAHGIHEADNPMFASVILSDGPLFAHELDGLVLPGSVVVLSACEVGGATSGVGGEPLGLSAVLLRLGARAVIASVAPLPDDAAAALMPRLHAELRASDDPEGALALALADVDGPLPLVCFSSIAGLAPASASELAP